MAALLVVLENGNPPREEDLRRVLAAMARLGPDGSSILLSGPAGLAHGAFVATPDPSGTHGFFRLPGSDLAVAADVRLDDRPALLDALGIPQAEGAATGDAELLLRAYMKWDEAFVERIRGDFAFLLWDGARRRLLAARDPFGTRPLYWTGHEGRFAAATSARALLRLRWTPPRLRESRIADAVVDFLELHDPEGTFFEGVHRLPAACLMTVEPGGRPRTRRTWDLATAAGRGPAILGREALEGFRALFLRSVEARLRAAPPAGAMLSGGLDSGSIVAAARSLRAASGGTPLRTFSALSADEQACPEAPFVRAMLAGGGLDARLLRETEAVRLLPEIRRLSGEFEEPFEAGASPVPLLMFLLARESGVRVLLDGVDGDLATSLNEECIAHAAAEGRWGLAWSLSRGFGRFLGTSPLGLFTRLTLRHRLPRILGGAWRRLRRVDGPGEVLLGSPVDRDLALRLDLRGRVEGVIATTLGEGGLGEEAARAHAVRRAASLWLGPGAERYGRAAAACGVEARHPFADRDLVEFTVRVGYEEKVRGGVRKALLRNGLGDLLPPLLAARRVDAMSLNPLFQGALLGAEGAGLRDRVEEALAATAGYVDGDRVRARLREFRPGMPGNAEPELGRILVLGDWLRAVREEGCG